MLIFVFDNGRIGFITGLNVFKQPDMSYSPKLRPPVTANADNAAARTLPGYLVKQTNQNPMASRRYAHLHLFDHTGSSRDLKIWRTWGQR